MVAFAEEYGIPQAICGKLIVADNPKEIPRLENLRQRALAKGVPARIVSAEEVRDFELNVSGPARGDDGHN